MYAFSVCPSFCVNAKKFLVSTHKDFLVYADFVYAYFVYADFVYAFLVYADFSVRWFCVRWF